MPSWVKSPAKMQALIHFLSNPNIFFYPRCIVSEPFTLFFDKTLLLSLFSLVRKNILNKYLLSNYGETIKVLVSSMDYLTDKKVMAIEKQAPLGYFEFCCPIKEFLTAMQVTITTRNINLLLKKIPNVSKYSLKSSIYCEVNETLKVTNLHLFPICNVLVKKGKKNALVTFTVHPLVLATFFGSFIAGYRDFYDELVLFLKDEKLITTKTPGFLNLLYLKLLELINFAPTKEKVPVKTQYLQNFPSENKNDVEIDSASEIEYFSDTEDYPLCAKSELEETRYLWKPYLLLNINLVTKTKCHKHKNKAALFVYYILKFWQKKGYICSFTGSNLSPKVFQNQFKKGLEVRVAVNRELL